ncbi:SWI/SNF complex 60 kDa subunit [Cantharellus anzutake]|uniref:SWI/SNF complex 60 kDa subunit n=1 Tax=Cantharellus anzutake TaxID=1750568 RepID=UPI00190894AE|nr:SWI/SNF complex 60 kDa subunit [Cantharellus anzutake]KAF8340439.1 SWI/SNF complex 60 kDa subunit [Cantharellus anzutake]
MRELERKLDWTMARKVLEMQETVTKVIRKRRTLRVFVTHTVHDQVWQVQGKDTSVDFNTGRGIPSWELRIEGKLLDEVGVILAKDRNIAPPPPKFGSFLKSIVVDVDRDPRLYPEEVIVEWHKNPTLPADDGFSIRRRGDTSLRVRIIIHLDNIPEKGSVDPALSSIIGVKQGTRAECVTALWYYIKHNGLQDKNDRRVVRPDEKLRTLIPADAVLFQNVAEVVDRCLRPPEPVVIYHEIQINPQEPTKTRAFDIEVDMDDSILKTKIRDVLTRLVPTVENRVSQIDDEIAKNVQEIRSARLKRQFFQSFADDPQGFIKTWMDSQSRDLEVILGTDRGVPEELMRRSDFFRLPWVEEAVAVHEGMRMAGALPYQATR